MRKVLVSLCVVVSFGLSAQLSINSAGTTYTIDFDNNLSGVNEGAYDGSGLAPVPANGQLDGDAWEILGMSDGDHHFGNTNTGNDFTRGMSSGNVTYGGLYAFDVGGGDYAFGFQATDADFTPGEVILKLTNSTGNYIYEISLSYEIHEYNDEDYSSNIDLHWSYDNVNYYSALSFASTEVGAGTPSWVQHDFSTTVNVLIPDGSSLFLKWETTDNSGGGSRDELAIDDIEISAAALSENNPLIISEIMGNPENDGNGDPFSNENDPEWFEVFNNSGQAIGLGGLEISDNAGTHIVGLNTTVNSGQYFVFGNALGSNNGPYQENYIYSTLLFSNNGDEIEISYPDGTVIDFVNFTTWYSTLPDGNSIYFNGADTDDNNDQSYWTESSSREMTYSGSDPSADNGSPGTAASGQLLPLWITQLDGHYSEDQLHLNWKVEQTQGIDRFEMEWSESGSHFEMIGTVPAQSGQYYYHFSEGMDVKQAGYARIRQVDVGGAEFFTNIIRLDGGNDSNWRIFPNPTSNKIHLTGTQLDGATYQVLSVAGSLVQEGSINRPQIDVRSLPAGSYVLQIVKDERVLNATFLKQ